MSIGVRAWDYVIHGVLSQRLLLLSRMELLFSHSLILGVTGDEAG